MSIQKMIQSHVQEWVEKNKDEVRKIIEEICKQKIKDELYEWRDSLDLYEAGLELNEKIVELIVEGLAEEDIQEIAKKRLKEAVNQLNNDSFSLNADWYC